MSEIKGVTSLITMSLAVKLGSIAVHVDEYMSDNAHYDDMIAAKSLVDDPEVQEWLKKMDAVALLPKKRS